VLQSECVRVADDELERRELWIKADESAAEIARLMAPTAAC
jgi:hypothetical protein